MNAQEALNRTLLLCRDFVAPTEASDSEVIQGLQSATVAIVGDEGQLRTGAAQSAVTALAGLVLGYGCRLRLVIPEVRIIGHQPPLRGRHLRAGLVGLARDLIPGSDATVATSVLPDDFVFVVGNSTWEGVAQAVWRLGGSRWTGVVQRIGSPVPVWGDDFPMGALAAAAIASAEPFKAIISKLLSAKGIGRVYDELAPVISVSMSLGDEPLAQDPITIGELDIISGGAITNALLYALLRLPDAQAAVRVIEPERLELTNLNRYMLCRRSNVGDPKTDVLRTWQRERFSIQSCPVRLDNSTIESVAPLSQLVLVGTDDIPSRWFVQEQSPSWLGVGATAHFTVVVSEHSRDEACVGCLHPDDDEIVAPIGTISFASFWAGLLVAARLIHYLAKDRWTNARQAVEIAPLRIDAQHGVWWHPVKYSRRCPVCGFKTLDQMAG